MSLRIDHLVVAANSVEQGVKWLSEKLSVAIPAGGQHPVMGTHNHLMALGDGVFIEVIAVEPQAPVPSRPRWFGLDDPVIVASLTHKPRLLTWAVNTPDIESVIAASHVDLGVAEAITRGDLSWLISIREDGSLAAGGLLPAVLQWHSEQHPATHMVDLGCRLKSLCLTTRQPEWLKQQLACIGAADLVQVRQATETHLPGLVAQLVTPSGDVFL